MNHYFALLVGLLSFNNAYCMHRTRSLQELRHRNRAAFLYNHIPESLKNRSLTYYRSLIQQEDQFSCGSRMLSNADSLARAVYKTKTEGTTFENNLAYYLSNVNKLETIHRKIRSVHPEFNSGTELYDYQIYHAIDTKLHLLKDRFLTIYFDETHGMTTLDFTQMGAETYQSFCSRENNYVPLTQSRSFSYLLRQLKEKYDMIHFGCLTNEHWFLATIILNSHLKAQLFVIDSANNDVEHCPNMHHVIDQLLHYVAKKNEQLRSKES